MPTKYETKNVNGVDVPLTPEEIAEFEARDALYEKEAGKRAWDAAQENRRVAYRTESDPLAIKAVRLEWAGDPEAEEVKAECLAKVEEIRDRIPMPEKPQDDQK